MHSTFLALSLLLCPAALAQTFLVDANNGPETDFTTITAAVAAVPDGSTLVIREGVYETFAIDGKSLTLLGEAGAEIDWLGGIYTVELSNTTAAQTIVLRNLDMDVNITCSNCAGQIVLEDLEGLNPNYFHLGLQDCDHVTVRRCTFRTTALGPGVPACVECINSRVMFDDCTLWGINTRALNAVGSDVQARNTNMIFQFGGQTAITADSSTTLRLLGNANIAGQNGPPINGGVVRLGPGIQFVGLWTPIQAVSVTQVPDEFVTVSGATYGGSVSATLFGARGGIGLLVMGAPGPELTIPNTVNSWWLDPAISDGLTFGLTDFSVGATVPLPPIPVLLGAVYGFQGLYFHPTNGMSVSTPAMFVIR